MAAEEDESEGEDDLPLEMVDDAGRSGKVVQISVFYHNKIVGVRVVSMCLLLQN